MDAKIKDLIEQAQDVKSLPERLTLYKLLRDREIEILQKVADRAEIELNKTDTADIESGIKNLILVMRYCAMGMLLNDENFLKQRLLRWLEQIMALKEMRQINDVLYKLLNQILRQELSTHQLSLIQPLITTAQVTLIY
jgi:hypothetical protein